MKVLQLNCWFCDEGHEWESRLPALRAWVAHLDPDILCLQEIARGLRTDGSVTDMLRDITQGTPHDKHKVYGRASEFFFARDPLNHTLQLGNAIASRWPISDTELLPLPLFTDPTPRPTDPSRTSTDVGRSAIWACVESPEGPISVTCTHLNSIANHVSGETFSTC